MALSRSRKLRELPSAVEPVSLWEPRSAGRLASGLETLLVAGLVAGLEALLERPQGLGVGAGAAARLSDRGATGNGAGVGAVLAAEAFEAEELADEEPPEERRRP